MTKKCFWKPRTECNPISSTYQTHPWPPNRCQQDGEPGQKQSASAVNALKLWNNL
jgi:hypothetical protein